MNLNSSNRYKDTERMNKRVSKKKVHNIENVTHWANFLKMKQESHLHVQAKCIISNAIKYISVVKAFFCSLFLRIWKIVSGALLFYASKTIWENYITYDGGLLNVT